MKKPCQKCELWKTRKRIIEGRGTDNPDILFIIEYPEASDEVSGQALSGPTGNFFEKLLSQVEIASYYILPIVSCRNTDGNSPHPAQVLACSSRFLGSVRDLSPKKVVFLGKEALRWYKKEFHGAVQIMNPVAVYLSGEMRSPYLLTFIRQLKEVRKGVL